MYTCNNIYRSKLSNLIAVKYSKTKACRKVYIKEFDSVVTYLQFLQCGPTEMTCFGTKESLNTSFSLEQRFINS